MTTNDNTLNQLIECQALPKSFIHQVNNHYRPLAQRIAGHAMNKPLPLIVGINGCQGSGKSTLALFLQYLLQQTYQLNTAILSLDDFYLTHRERQVLARTHHPLFITRGVPGTHDVPLALAVIKKIMAEQRVTPPSFNKAMDDREPESAHTVIKPPVDIILFEGWCVGIPPQPDDQLTTPMNTLEAEEDSKGIWRSAVNSALKQDYAALFQHLHFIIYLKAPNFDCVTQWRTLQESKLITSSNKPDKTMDTPQLTRFIQHYERLTRYGFETMPQRVDITIYLDDHQQWVYYQE